MKVDGSHRQDDLVSIMKMIGPFGFKRFYDQ